MIPTFKCKMQYLSTPKIYKNHIRQCVLFCITIHLWQLNAKHFHYLSWRVNCIFDGWTPLAVLYQGLLDNISLLMALALSAADLCFPTCDQCIWQCPARKALHNLLYIIKHNALSRFVHGSYAQVGSLLQERGNRLQYLQNRVNFIKVGIYMYACLLQPKNLGGAQTSLGGEKCLILGK